MKLNSFGMKSHPKRNENTLIEGIETTLKRYEMMSKVWKNTNDTKVWNRCTRYERQHKVWKMCQGMKNVLKVYNFSTRVWNAFSRYETRVFFKNSGFSYLYGSISYLFGYEKNRCFSLMRLARRYLAMPPTSSSVERLFSVSGQVVTAKRARLDPSTVTLLVFYMRPFPGVSRERPMRSLRGRCVCWVFNWKTKETNSL